MFPFGYQTYRPAYNAYSDDEYEQYYRAQQRRQQERQAYEQYLRQQAYEQYVQQQALEQYQQRQYAAYVREKERQKRAEQKRREERQRQLELELQAQLERQRRQQQLRAEAKRRQEAVEAARQQQLREQFVNRHQDGPITLSFFDLLDYLGQGVGNEEQAESESDESVVSETAEVPILEAIAGAKSPSVASALDSTVDGPAADSAGADAGNQVPDPAVSEPEVEEPEEVVAKEEPFSRRKSSVKSSHSAKHRGSRRPSHTHASEPQPSVNLNAGILRTIKPRFDLEVERAGAIFSRNGTITDVSSAKQHVRSLKEAHLRVEAIYTQLDSLKVNRTQRAEKHRLTSTAVDLADKIDDELARSQEKLSELKALEPASESEPESVPASPKHHVTIEEVDE